MPHGRETVVNKPISGQELKEILRADFERVLEGEGLLSSYMAYGRIAYDITLRLHLDNPMRPESEVRIPSSFHADDPALEPSPLRKPSPEAVVAGDNLHRAIKSPNEERLRHGLTLPVETRGQDGTVQTQQVKYPPQPELGPGDMTITDDTPAAREAWKVPVR
jgi:hypothetical protein